jgi:antitoxin component of MazEF toxin-antitoxin module
MAPLVGRIHKYGGSLALLLSRRLLTEIPLRHGDFVVIRVSGEKLVVERIPMENLAKVHTSELAEVPG